MQNNNMINENLIIPAYELLKNKKIREHNFEKPTYPACIFYFGKNSESYMKEMCNDLLRGWGDSARHIKHFSVRNPHSFEDSMYDFEDNRVTVEALQEEITVMMRNSTVFSDMNYVNVYCILETTSMSVEDFEKWYALINTISEKLIVPVRSFLMVILNQSLNCIEETNRIRQALLDLYNSNKYSNEKTHIYNSVFLLSNRLKNGGYINLEADSQEYIDYNLFADIILLTNTDNDDLRTRIGMLYDKRVPAFTAAYGNLSKPINDIVMITLKKSLNIIKNSIDDEDSGYVATNDLILQMLNIKGGNMPFIDEFYKNHIYPKISDLGALNYLPGNFPLNNISYEEANEKTQGCLELFVKYNYFDFVSKTIQDNKAVIVKQLKNQIAKNMSVEQQKSFRFFNGNIESIVSNALVSNAVYADKKKMSTENAIRVMIRRRVVEQFVPIVTQVLKDLRNNTQGSLKIFGDLYRDVNQLNSSGNEGLRQNLQTHYENIVSDYYIDRSKVNNITKTILTECSTEAEVVSALRRELENIISYSPVYSMSFVDELVGRVEALGEGINTGALIARELVNNLDNKIALNSCNMFRDCFFEAYFLNTEQNSKNSLYNALQQKANNHHIPVTYYNTLSNDMVESVWFYKCTEDNVRI